MNRDRLLLFLLSALLFIPFLGHVHLFDWDEINFAESAREMLETGNWWQVTINYEPFREKPPLFFWMQALSMSIFGVGEFAARLPNAICGIITLQVLYSIALKWQTKTFAWIWVLLYVASFLPHLYFKSGIIDPWFNLFIFLSIYHLFIAIEHKHFGELKHSALAGLFSGLAILTKGPVGLLLLILTFSVWLIFNRFRKPASLQAILIFIASSFTVTSLWFGYETIKNGPWFLIEFIQYQLDLFTHPVAGHQQPFYYHFMVVLVGCFPMSILALTAFRKSFHGDEHNMSKWMKYLFWVVMILFSIVTTKIVHYSSMSYIPLSYLAALVVFRQLSVPTIKGWQFKWIKFQALLLGLVFTALPLALLFKDQWLHLIKDPFAQANLSAPVYWMGWEGLLGLVFIALTFYALRLRNREPHRAFLVLTLGSAFIISSLMVVIVPKVEGYSQRSLIEFYESHADEDAHFTTVKFKSYAHFFYGSVKPNSGMSGKEYIVCKIQHQTGLLEQFQGAIHLYDKGGFSFYVKLD